MRKKADKQVDSRVPLFVRIPKRSYDKLTRLVAKRMNNGEKEKATLQRVVVDLIDSATL